MLGTAVPADQLLPVTWYTQTALLKPVVPPTRNTFPLKAPDAEPESSKLGVLANDVQLSVATLYDAKPLPVSPSAQYTMPVVSISAHVGASLVRASARAFPTFPWPDPCD